MELNHTDAVEVTVREGPERVRELAALGAHFDTRPDGQLDLTREGGHSARRIVHSGDITGREVERALLAAADDRPNIHFVTDAAAIDLILERKSPHGQPRCLGAYVLLASGQIETFLGRVTVLATGGAGKVYLYTTNPDVATGDGVAMAYRAGARIANMEFYQFHPTCLFSPEAKNFLITEALRGEGGKLRLRSGAQFMDRYDPRAELAPRDIVARAIDSELKRTGDDYVLLDMTHLGRAFLIERFPNIYAACSDFGIDMAVQPIPVVPAAHYQCGGVSTDLFGRTSVPGLYAVGEVAHTGLHGANRLASNSLLEGLVFGHRAAQAAAEEPAPQAVGRRRPGLGPGLGGGPQRGGAGHPELGRGPPADVELRGHRPHRQAADARPAPAGSPPGGDPRLLLAVQGDPRRHRAA